MTILEALQKLPTPFKEMAIHNFEKLGLFNAEYECAADCLMGAFKWADTSEGGDFWEAVHEEMKHYEKLEPRIMKSK